MFRIQSMEKYLKTAAKQGIRSPPFCGSLFTSIGSFQCLKMRLCQLKEILFVPGQVLLLQVHECDIVQG